MTQVPLQLLIVESDRELAATLAVTAASRDSAAVGVASATEAYGALERRTFDAAVIDLSAGAEEGFDLLRTINERHPSTVTVVTSAAPSVDVTVRSYEMAAFRFVPKPYDVGRLLETVREAVDHGWNADRHHRLFWELQIINEIADGITHSLELTDVLTGALQRLRGALGLAGGAIRLRDELTGEYGVAAVVGAAAMHRIWTRHGGEIERPSDRVLATRRAVVIEDLAPMVQGDDATPLPARSAASVPMFVGDELVGTLTVTALAPRRFTLADQRLLTTIAGQIGAAVQNARLHACIQRGKRDWEKTFDAIGDPIAVYDARGEVLRGNTALARHLRLPVTALVGLTCRDVGFCGGGCPVCAVGRADFDTSHAEVTTLEGRIFSVTTFPVAGGPDDAAVVQVAKDVTEEIASARRMRQLGEELASANRRSMTALMQLKAAQAQLVQAEKLSAIGHLVAGVAHELNNPLTSIIGYAQLLEGELRASPHAPDVRHIAEESERAARIVRNLLAFARRQTAARAPHDAGVLFERTLASREHALRSSGITLERAFEPRLPPVVGDGNQLQQALMNLVLNAEYAMRNRDVKQLRVGARFDEAAGAVELFVTDSGPGIDKANLTRIFDPFFTTRDVGEGTGLGLSICYGIVRDHGGQILVDTTTHAGTSFSLLLPARVDEPQQSHDVLIAQADGEGNVIGAALEGWGYRVASAATTSEALERYARGVHGLFLDVTLLAADPAAWRAARTDDRSRAPVILMGLCEEAEVDRFRREHASAVLVPPFQLRPLRTAVRALAKEYV